MTFRSAPSRSARHVQNDDPLSQRVTTFMRCSIRMMVIPRSAMARITFEASSISVGLSPALTSSSNSRRGPHRKALGELEFLAAGERQGRCGIVGDGGKAGKFQLLHARSRAPSRWARVLAAEHRAGRDIVQYRQVGETAAPPGTCARYRCPARTGAGRDARHRTRSPSWPGNAGDQVDQRGLARTVRSDQADDLACLQLKRYLVDGPNAGKVLRHRGAGAGRSFAIQAAHLRPGAGVRPRICRPPVGRNRIRPTTIRPRGPYGCHEIAPDQLLEHQEHDRADDRAQYRAGSAQQRHDDRLDRNEDIEGVGRIDVGDPRAVDRAAGAAIQRGQGEREDLVKRWC